jgi:HEAT repeat protein
MKIIRLKIVTRFQHFCILGFALTALSANPLFANQVADFAKATKGQYWIHYQVPMEGNNDLCCKDDNWNSHWRVSCTLADNSRRLSASANPSLADTNLQVFIKVDDHQITDLRSFSSICVVDTDSQTTYLMDDIAVADSVSLLYSLIDTNSYNGISKRALMAMALHQGEEAQTQLERLASKGNEENHNTERRRDAIFWLGSARNEIGFKFLQGLLESETDTKLRKQIVFAISQSNSADALHFLVNLSKNDSDPKVRSHALFWLAESEYPRAEEFILAAVNQDPNRHVREEAVFHLSRIDSDTARQHLMQLAQNHVDSEIQEKAIFWLAESGDNRAKTVLVDMLHENHSYQIKEKVVFALSQLDAPLATKSLIYVVENIKDPRLAKKALFWLNQSDEEEAVKFIASLF